MSQTDSHREKMVKQCGKEVRQGWMPSYADVVPHDPSLRSCRPDNGCIRSLPKHQPDEQPLAMSCLGWQIESALNVAVLDGNKLKVAAKGSAPTG